MEARIALESIRTCCQDLVMASRLLPPLLDEIIYHPRDRTKEVLIGDFLRAEPTYAVPSYQEAVSHDRSSPLASRNARSFPAPCGWLAPVDVALRLPATARSSHWRLFRRHLRRQIRTWKDPSLQSFGRTPTPTQALARLVYAMEVPYD